MAWLAAYITSYYVRPKTLTHPSTNRARRRVTSSIRPTQLPLRQTAARDTCSGDISVSGAAVASRRSIKLGYRGSSMPTFASLCDEADERLFYQVTNDTRHLLHPLLPPRRDRHYSLRQRVHYFELPDRTLELKNKNFMMRMLFKQDGCSTSQCSSFISQS